MEKQKMEKIRKVSLCGLGIALYVAISMTVKIPLVGHAALDLGYIVLAVYCYHFGPVSGAVVGGVGCMFVSLLTSGWFPPGWIVGNVLIGAIVGTARKEKNVPAWRRIAIVVFAVFLGIFCTKTAIECVLYSIPLAVKAPKSAVVFAVDAVTMIIGTLIAPKIPANGGKAK